MNREYLIGEINRIYNNIITLDTEARDNIIKCITEDDDIAEFILLSIRDTSLFKFADEEEMKRCYYLCFSVNHLLYEMGKGILINKHLDTDSLHNLNSFIGYYFFDDGELKITIEDDYSKYIDMYEAIHVEDNQDEGTQDVRKILDKLNVFADIALKKEHHIKNPQHRKIVVDKEILINKINEIYNNITTIVTNAKNGLLNYIDESSFVGEFVQRAIDNYNYDVLGREDEDGYRYYCRCAVVNYYLSLAKYGIEINKFHDTNSLVKLFNFVEYVLLDGLNYEVIVDDDYCEYPIEALHVTRLDDFDHYDAKKVLETLEKLVDIMMDKHKNYQRRRKEFVVKAHEFYKKNNNS